MTPKFGIVNDNQTNDDTEGAAFFLLAEGLIFLLSLLRIFVVAVVLAVNIIALRRSTYSSQAVKCRCLHFYISDSVKVCSIVYIVSWTPFLFYSLFNGRWLWIDEQIFCLIQNYITNAILVVLLAMAALTAWNKMRYSKTLRPQTAGLVTLSAWVLPQLAYLIILTLRDDSQSRADFDFLDDLLQTSEKTGTLGLTYKIGFTICGQSLHRLALTQYILQYIVIILPLSLLALFAATRYTVSKCRKQSPTNEDKTPIIGTSDLLLDRCDCTSAGEGPALEIILGTNVIWLLVLRPCVLLLWSREHLFVDLGSHLMLTIAAVFAPILPNQKIRRQMSDGIFQIESSEVTKTVDVD